MLGAAAFHRSFTSPCKGDLAGADDAMRPVNGYRTHSVRLLSKACMTPDGVQSDATIAAAAANTLLDVGDLCTTLSAIGICNSDCET